MRSCHFSPVWIWLLLNHIENIHEISIDNPKRLDTLKKPLAKFKSAKIGLLLVWVFVLKKFNVLSSCSLFLFSLLLLSHLNCRISLPNSRLSYIQSVWCVCVRSANAFHTDNKILYANNGRRFRLLGEILTRHFTLKLMLNRPKKVIFFIFLNMSSI